MPVSLELKAKVQLRWVRNITIYDELYDIWSVPCATWMGQVGAVSMSMVTRYVTEKQSGLVMTSARRACRLYSQRWCEKDETELGKKESKGKRTVSFSDNIIYFVVLGVGLYTKVGWWVKHVVISRVEHGFAPAGPTLHALLVLYHHWNNTAT